MVNPSADNNSLWKRYLNNPMRLRGFRNGGVERPGVYRYPYSGWDACRDQLVPEYPDYPGWAGFTNPANWNGDLCNPSQNLISTGTPWETVNPLTAATEGYNQLIVFLVRGVDPYSTRNENSYNLGRLFGYDYSNPNAPIVTGSYKLNIPIQAKLRNAQHDQISTNTGVSSYSNTGIFYQNYNYQPSINDFSAFTTSLHGYYSALDSTKINNYDIGNVFPPPGSSHIPYPLTTDNSFIDPNYNDIRVQGPRSWQKHASNTTLGTYWNTTDPFFGSVNCAQDEIVYPQYYGSNYTQGQGTMPYPFPVYYGL
jgi:hypothetical protein